MNFPYSDEYMRYDYKTHHYVLTKKYILEELGVDLDKGIKGSAKNSELILRRISNLVYNFIHKHSANNNFQDYIIAKTEKGRDILFRAMSEQFLYMRMVGDLSTSTDYNKRALALDDTVLGILYEDIPEIQTTICYTGNIWFKSNDLTEW